MNSYDISKINKDELQALGLVDKEGKIKLSEENKERLKKGMLTDEITLKNIGLDSKLYDVPAKISLYQQGNNEELRLKVHPFFQEREVNNKLSTEEMKYVSEKKETLLKHTEVSGKLLDYGKAPYQFDKKQKESYYIKLESNNKEKYVWGGDVGRCT